MKKLPVFFACFFLFIVTSKAQSVAEKYDSVLANNLHADNYGMKNYILVLLKPGSNTSFDKPTKDSIFHGHLNNIGRLADNGNLVLAGPFGENKLYSGLFILNVSNFEDAKKLLSTDPAIMANLLDAELYPWYGTASLQQIPLLHKKIQKLNF